MSSEKIHTVRVTLTVDVTLRARTKADAERLAQSYTGNDVRDALIDPEGRSQYGNVLIINSEAVE